MKLLLFFVGITSVWAAHGGQFHICSEEDQNGVVTNTCCEGWTGFEDGCVTPVCVEDCTLQGGTCISPNTCRCPGGKVAQDCSRSRCEEERHSHEMLSWKEKRRTFKPSCLSDGSYTILQCNDVIGSCFCVDRWTGEMIVSTLTRGVPDCEEYYAVNEEQHLFRPKEVIPLRLNGQVDEEPTVETEEEEETAIPPCAKEHKKWKDSILLSYFRSEPQCTKDGFYVSHRCDFIFGFCVCLDRNTGEDIESTKVHSVNIDCTGVSAPDRKPESTSVVPNVFPEDGCVFGNTYHSPGQRFFRDCNMCTCHGYNVIQCTDRPCERNACYLGETGKIMEHVMNGECHRCTCENGVTECSTVDCNVLENPEEVENLATCDRRPSDSHFYNECNRCWCTRNNGLSFCTEVGCASQSVSCWVDGRGMSNGQYLTRGCDTLRCVDGQVEVIESCADFIDHEMRFSGRNPEGACFHNDQKFLNGESMLYGFKLCECRNFDWDCKPMIHHTMQ